MARLTQTTIDKAEIRTKSYFLFDDRLHGFCVRIAPSGKKHYYFQYTIKGNTRRIMIEQHGIVSAAEARGRARRFAGMVEDGIDPLALKHKEREEPSVKKLALRFLDEYVNLKCKPSTQGFYASHIRAHIIPALGRLKVSEIKKHDIALLHHDLRKTPGTANGVLKTLNRIFNLAEMWELRPAGSNPCRHIPFFKLEKRERYLTSEEIKQLSKTIDTYPNKAAGFAIMLLLLTGCRKSEITYLKWSQIDFDAGILFLEDSKTGAKPVYIGQKVVKLLRIIQTYPTRPQTNPYVIWGSRAGEPSCDLYHHWRKIRKSAGLTKVRLHDLRHNFASAAVSQGMSLPVIGRLLGHSQIQTTARYAHLMDEPMKLAASQMGDIFSKHKVRKSA